MTLLAAVAGWFAIGWLLMRIIPEEEYGPGAPSFDTVIFYDGLVLGHLMSFPGLLGAAVILSRSRLTLAPLWRGFMIAVVHFLLGLALFGLTWAIGGYGLSLICGLIYLFLSWGWAALLRRWVERRDAERDA